MPLASKVAGTVEVAAQRVVERGGGGVGGGRVEKRLWVLRATSPRWLIAMRDGTG